MPSLKIIPRQFPALTNRTSRTLREVAREAQDIIENLRAFRREVFNVMQHNQKAILTGTAAPTASATFVGQIFVNTTVPTVYISTGTGSGASDWTVVS